MTSVYSDAQIYNDIEREEVPADELIAFRDARTNGELVVHLGLPDLEESLAVWRQDRAIAARRMLIIRDFAGFQGLLKQPSDLLEQTIRAYANGWSPPSPLMARHDRRHSASLLAKIARRSSGADSAVAEILAGVKRQKEDFKTSMEQGRAQSLAELGRKYTQRELSLVPFEDFFGRAGLAPVW